MEKFGYINVLKESSDTLLFVNINSIQAVKVVNHTIKIQLVSGDWVETEYNLASFTEAVGKVKSVSQ